MGRVISQGFRILNYGHNKKVFQIENIGTHNHVPVISKGESGRWRIAETFKGVGFRNKMQDKGCIIIMVITNRSRTNQ